MPYKEQCDNMKPLWHKTHKNDDALSEICLTQVGLQR